MAGIFQNGVWTCGLDFLPDGVVAAGGVFDVPAGGAVAAANARFTGKGVRFNGGNPNNGFLGRSFGTNLVSFYCGFALDIESLPGGGNIETFFTAYDTIASSGQFSVGYNGTGQIGLYQGGLYNGTGSATPISGSTLSSFTIIPNAYGFVEVYGLINPSAGIITIRYNGNTVLTFTGNTRQTANSSVGRVYLGALNSSGGAAIPHRFDDVYILDGTGSAPLNTFLGPGHIITDGPNADSATAGLNTWAATSPQGTDYGNAANIPPNTAQYNSSGTVGQRMSLRFPPFSPAQASQCLILNTWYNAELDAAGVRTITPIYRSGTTDQAGAPISLTGTYVYYSQNSILNPATGLNWSQTDLTTVAGCEIGLQVAT